MRRYLIIQQAITLFVVQCGLRGCIVVTRERLLVGLGKLLQWCNRGIMLGLWRVSRRVSTILLEERMGTCFACEVADPDATGIYCGACGCPKWSASELNVKNGRRLHNCPLGKHEGSVRLVTIGGCKNCGKKVSPPPRPDGLTPEQREEMEAFDKRHSGTAEQRVTLKSQAPGNGRWRSHLPLGK